MKLLFLLSLTVIAATGIHAYLSRRYRSNKKNKQFQWTPLLVTSLFVFVVLSMIFFTLYKSATAPDTQCTTLHSSSTVLPKLLQSGMDYFLKGNYDYEIGNCEQAVIDYTRAIFLNPVYPEAYNNRAYTYMRMQKYQEALSDLDKAIQLNPNYTQALMNRGDIHNYYYQIDRNEAIADYKRAIVLLGSNRYRTSVCGHLFLAEHNGWNIGTLFGYISGQFLSCR